MTDTSTRSPWPEPEHQIIGCKSELALGLLSKLDYSRARLCVAFCEGVSDAFLQDLFERKYLTNRTEEPQ